jgi:YaiO family outer membrane protein
MTRRRIAACVFACLLACPAAADTSPRDALAQAETAHAERPLDPAARFGLARALGWNERYEAALSMLDALVADYPDNLDYRLQRARVLGWMGRVGDALQTLDDVQARAPDYPGAAPLRRQLEARLAPPPDAPAGAGQAEAVATATGGDDGEWRLTAGATVESLTGGRDGWNAQTLDLDRVSPNGWRWGVGTATASRFGNRDTSLSLRAGRAPAPGWQADGYATVTPSASFTPSREIGARVRRALPRGWVAGADVSARRYADVDVDIASLVAERYMGQFRVAWRASFSWLDGGDRTLSNALSADWYRDARTSVGIVLASGRESEAVAPGRVLQTDVRSITLTGRRDLSGTLTLRWFAGTHEQGDIYRRNYAGFSLTTRF